MDGVEDLYRQLLAAWNRCDAPGWGERFAEDGTLVGFDGSPVDSRTAVVEHLGQVFGDHQPAAYVGVVREVRPLAPGVALLRAVAGMVPPGETAVRPEVHTVHVLVAVDGGDGWRAAHFQATPAALHGRREAVEALTAELQAVVDADGVA